MRPSEDGADVASPVSIMEWFMSFYEHKESVGCKPAECTLRAGELLFVPVSMHADCFVWPAHAIYTCVKRPGEAVRHCCSAPLVARGICQLSARDLCAAGMHPAC